MIAACWLMAEPNHTKALHQHLDSVSQCMSSYFDIPHANAYLALMSAEMYVTPHHGRSPVDAARVLLQAAGHLSRYSLLCGLLMERASMHYLQAAQYRKFVFHEVLTGNKILRIGRRPAVHSAVCFSCAMLVLESGAWGDLKSKLCKQLSQNFKFNGREGAQRSLLLMLKVLSSILHEDNTDVGNKDNFNDAIAVLSEIVGEGPWGSVNVVC